MKKQTPNLFSARSRVCGFMAACAALIALAEGSAHASSASWNVNANGNWNAIGSWDAGGIPGSTSTDNTDVATFGFTLTATHTVTVDTNRYIGGISFGNTSNFGYLLSGGILHLNSTGVIQSLSGDGTHTDTISSAIVLDGNAGTATFTAGATSTLSLMSITTGGITGVSTSGNTTTLTLNGSNTGSNLISAVIGDGASGGNLAIIKNDAGTWALSGANTFTGGVTLNSGTLDINNAKALGAATGTFTINGGSIDNSSAGNLTVSNNNPLVWNSDFTYIGSGASGAASLNLGTGSVTLGSTAGATRTVTVNANTLTVGGNISNGTNGTTPTINLTKAGSGTLTLTGTNAYTGTTTILAGTLIQGSTNALGAGNTTSILLGDTANSNNAYLGLGTGNNSTLARNVIVQAGNTGIAEIEETSFSSNTETLSGTITLGSTVAGTPTGHGLTLANGGFDDLEISGLITDPSPGGTTSPGVLTINGNANGQLYITKTSNNYAGGTQLLGGYVGFAGTGTFLGTGTLVINGGGFVEGIHGNSTLSANNVMVWDADFALTSNGSFSPGSLNLGTGAVSLGDGNQTASSTRTITVNSSILTVGGVISNSTSGSTVNNLNKAGSYTLALGGASTYTGSTTISQGKLQLTTGNDRLPTSTVLSINGSNTTGAVGGIFDLNTRSQTVAGLMGGSGTAALGLIANGGATTTSTLTVNNTNASEFDGALINSGNTGALALAKNGTGTLTLTGVSSFTGGTTVNAGTLVITGGTSNVSGTTLTGNLGASGGNAVTNNTITGLSSTSGLVVGESVTNANLPAGTFITAITSGTVTLSNFSTNASAVTGTSLVFGGYTGSALGTGSVSVGANATLAGTGTYSGSGFSIQGTNTSNRANVLVGKVSTSDTNTASSLTLKGTTASTIANANLSFNLNVSTAGALGSDPSGSGTELNVGATAITFGGTTGSVQFTLNMQNEPGIVAAFTPYVLIAGTVASGGGGTNGSQYSGLTLGTTTMLASGVTESVITGNNLQLAFGTALDTSYYGANSYLVLYQDTNNGIDDIDVVVVPEPGTWAMMLGGLGALICWQRRKDKRD